MSVVGIDFGNLQSIIAVARNRGIDVICNEVSNRATPSLVSFGSRQRFVGESAKTQEISNFKNTVGSLKRLVGRSFKDPEIASTEAAHINADLVEVEGGGVGVRVNYLGEEKVFSATQLVATYFSKLKETILAETKQNVSSRPDVVISVPPWFTDNQRASIIDAADIAGLNCLRVINDSTASALGYGITKADLPEEKPRHVMFVDIGHSNCSVAVVAFKKGELTVKSTVWDRDFGGRNFDELLVDHFAREFKEKYNIDVRKNNKALFRLRTGCERLKKILSANSQAPLSIESIMEDKDVSSMLTRAEFETMSSQLLERVEPTLWKALKDAGLEIEDLDALEVVGGCTRIPAVKERLASFIGREVSTTLNQDEAVARGCALQCAVISPVFKVRDFAVNDIAPHPIKFVWKALPGQSEADCQLDVFTRQQTVPSTKLLSFRRKEDFTVEACYADMSRLPPGTPEVVGRYHVKDVKSPAGEEFANVKLRARINLNGILSVEGAFLVEEVKTEEKDEAPTPMEIDSSEGTKPSGEAAKPPVETAKPAEAVKAADGAANPSEETAKPAGGAEEPNKAENGEKKEEEIKPVKKKKTVKKTEIPVISDIRFGLDERAINLCKEEENEMVSRDRLVAATEEAKNTLEEYVYDARSRLEGIWNEHCSEDEKAVFIAALNAAEEWLYNEGEDSTRDVYATRLGQLREMGKPIADRYAAANRPPTPPPPAPAPEPETKEGEALADGDRDMEPVDNKPSADVEAEVPQGSSIAEVD